MRIKKKYMEDYSSFNLVCPSLLHTKKKLKECNNTLLKHSKKYLAVTASLMMTVSSFGVMPVFAADDYGDDASKGATASVEATTAGDTSLVSEKPEAVQCTSDQLSYTDESALTEGQGTLICSQSNGVYALVSGNENPTSYHWVAWYKNKSDDEPDVAESDGNYKGFAQSKVDAWSQYSDEIKELNGDSFPESRDYTYPTDTEKGQIDFWADTSGYYTVLGDPKYDNLEVTAYENVSYAKEEVTVNDTILSKAGSDSPFTTDSDGNLMVDGNSPAVDKVLDQKSCDDYAALISTEFNVDLDANVCKQRPDETESGGGIVLTDKWSTYMDCKTSNCKYRAKQKTVVGDDGVKRRITQMHDTNGYTSVKVEKMKNGKWVIDKVALKDIANNNFHANYDKDQNKVFVGGFCVAWGDFETGSDSSKYMGTKWPLKNVGGTMNLIDNTWNYGKSDTGNDKKKKSKSKSDNSKSNKSSKKNKSDSSKSSKSKSNKSKSSKSNKTSKKSNNNKTSKNDSKKTPDFLDAIRDNNEGFNEIIGEPVSDTTQEYTVDDVGNNVLRETTTTVSYYNTDVTIAKATVEGSVYATELAQMPLLSLEKGSGSDFAMSIAQNEDSFWKNTKPSYWGNDGKITVKNDSSTSWHFATLQDSADDFEENFVSLYAQLPHTDKVLPFAHPYNNVQYIDKLTNQDYPDGIEETCFSIGTGNGKTRQVCAKPQTPLMKVHLDVDGDTPQVDVDDEVEKKITLSKDKDGKDSSKDNDSSTSNNDSNSSGSNNKADTSLPKVDDCAQTPWNHGVCDD